MKTKMRSRKDKKNIQMIQNKNEKIVYAKENNRKMNLKQTDFFLFKM